MEQWESGSRIDEKVSFLQKREMMIDFYPHYYIMCLILYISEHQIVGGQYPGCVMCVIIINQPQIAQSGSSHSLLGAGPALVSPG